MDDAHLSKGLEESLEYRGMPDLGWEDDCINLYRWVLHTKSCIKSRPCNDAMRSCEDCCKALAISCRVHIRSCKIPTGSYNARIWWCTPLYNIIRMGFLQDKPSRSRSQSPSDAVVAGYPSGVGAAAKLEDDLGWDSIHCV